MLASWAEPCIEILVELSQQPHQCAMPCRNPLQTGFFCNTYHVHFFDWIMGIFTGKIPYYYGTGARIYLPWVDPYFIFLKIAAGRYILSQWHKVPITRIKTSNRFNNNLSVRMLCSLVSFLRLKNFISFMDYTISYGETCADNLSNKEFWRTPPCSSPASYPYSQFWRRFGAGFQPKIVVVAHGLHRIIEARSQESQQLSVDGAMLLDGSGRPANQWCRFRGRIIINTHTIL